VDDPELARAQRREAKAAKARQAQDDSVVQVLMGSVAGRAWAHDVLEDCGVFRTTFTGEALQSAFNEGKRNVGLRLLSSIMQACPQAYVQMMGEQNGGPDDPGYDRSDPDEPRNYDSAGRWIGIGEGADDSGRASED
jgi:hypothetical protein